MSENRVFLQKYIICRLKKIRVPACQGDLLRRSRLPCMLSFLYTLINISNNISISFYGYRTKSIFFYREENKKRAIPMDFTIFNKIHVSITKNKPAISSSISYSKKTEKKTSRLIPYNTQFFWPQKA